MTAQTVWLFDFSHWLTWVSLAAGVGVAWLVFVASGRFLPQHRRAATSVPSEDKLAWETLLDLFPCDWQ